MAFSLITFGLFWITAAAELIFTTQFVAEKLPHVSGKVQGTFKFQPGAVYYSYDNAPGVCESFKDFEQKIEYIACDGVCIKYREYSPELSFEINGRDTRLGNVQMNGKLCTGYQKGSQESGVDVVWLDAETQLPCQLELMNGAVYRFHNLTELPNRFSVPSTYTCLNDKTEPCDGHQVLRDVARDVVFVVQRNLINYLGPLLHNMLRSYKVDPLNMAIGVVSFDDEGSEIQLPLTYSLQSINSTASMFSRLPMMSEFKHERACLPCTIQRGLSMLDAYGRMDLLNNLPVDRYVVVVVESSAKFEPLQQKPLIKNVHPVVVDIGPPSSADAQQTATLLTQYFAEASHVVHIDSKTQISGFQFLDLLQPTLCAPETGNHCGLGCHGLCLCGKTCVCTDCDDGNPKTVDMCNPFDRSCSHEDRLPFCSKAQQDEHQCPPPDVCTESGCNKDGSCVNRERSCDDGDACTADSCRTSDPNVPCHHTDISMTCSSNNPCQQDNVCNPALGCIHPPVDCDSRAEFVDLVKQGCYRTYCNVANGTGCTIERIPNTECGVESPPPSPSVRTGLSAGLVLAIALCCFCACGVVALYFGIVYFPKLKLRPGRSRFRKFVNDEFEMARRE